MTRMSNQEKSARRYGFLSTIAEEFAKQNKGFRDFLASKQKDDGEKVEPTWRRLETFIKQQAEAGATVKIVIESSEGSD